MNSTILGFIMQAQTALIFILLLLRLKTNLFKLTYRNKYVSYMFLDTKIQGRAISKDNIFAIDDMKYVVPANYTNNQIIFYDSRVSEPVKTDFDVSKCTTYIDSREYSTILDNTILKQIMISRESALIKQIMMFVLIILIVMVFLGYYSYTTHTQVARLINLAISGGR